MCDICGRAIHLPGCPNNPDNAPIGFCVLCGGEIYDGELFTEEYGDMYHDECYEAEIDDGEVVAASDYGNGYKDLRRRKLHFDRNDRMYFNFGKIRCYLDEIMRV